MAITPRELYDSVSAEKPYSSRMTRVPLEELDALVSHHTCRNIKVRTEHFGLASMETRQVQYRLRDEFFLKMASKTLSQVHAKYPDVPLKLEVSVSIDKIDRVKHEAYRICIFSIGVWHDGSVWSVP